MTQATTNAFSDFRTRRIRDTNDLIIQVRQFNVKAKLGSVCKVINIKRDTSTRLIMTTWTAHEKVVQDDLDAIIT